MRPQGFAAAMLFAGLIFSRATYAADDEPIKKIDRMRIVGDPVLDQTAAEGLHVWLQDGWYHIAAVTELPFGTKKKVAKTFSVRIASSEPITTDLGAFKKVRGGDQQVELKVTVGPRPEQTRFKTDGEVTISGAVDARGKAVPIMVGPAARRAASTVRIGKY
jgi:hypothetical protein